MPLTTISTGKFSVEDASDKGFELCEKDMLLSACVAANYRGRKDRSTIIDVVTIITDTVIAVEVTNGP